MSTTSEVETDAELAATRGEVVRRLLAADRLIIAAHERPDGDSLGSMVALRDVLGALGKDCRIYIDSADLPLSYEYRWLSLEGLTRDTPDDIGERVAVFLDCGNIDRSPHAAALAPAGGFHELINIDHHHDNTRFGTVNYVVPHASCVAEIIWDLLPALGAQLTRSVAEALYVALITDTGCFMYENTGPRAHVMAASLIRAGADVHLAYQRIYEGVPDGKLALLARGLAHIERYDDGALTATYVTVEDFQESGAETSYSEGIVDHLRAVRGTELAAVAREVMTPEHEPVLDDDGARLHKVSLRATDRAIDVSAISRVVGGGGHPAAAGFTTAMPWPELVEFLRAQLAAQREAQ
jgi:phosphoesterase RecJ-like protein